MSTILRTVLRTIAENIHFKLAIGDDQILDSFNADHGQPLCENGDHIVDKLLTDYFTKCNGQRIRLYIREGFLCGVGGNLCKR
jgi:hypothetical protein